MTVNIPPAAPSAFAGQSGCVQVVVNSINPLCSAQFGVFRLCRSRSKPWPRRRMAPYSTAAILLLAPSGTAMTLSGSTQVVAVNGGIMVDSTSASSVISSGTSTITAPVLDLAGGIKYSGTNPDNATITNYDQPNIPDPLANIAAPSSSGMPVESNSAINRRGNQIRDVEPRHL